jgi:hypothetical protein
MATVMAVQLQRMGAAKVVSRSFRKARSNNPSATSPEIVVSDDSFVGS